MPLKRIHIVTSGRITKPAIFASDGTTKTVVGVVQPKRKTKPSSPSADVAKKSFTGLIRNKSEIASALRNGKSLTEIKGIRFVKPF